jgi:DNA-binding transcriptional regulator LsrR (DeoR family)
MAQLMPSTAVENITVVQLGTAVVYLGDRAVYSSAEAALQVAQKLGSMERLMLIPLPLLLDSEMIRDALVRDTGVRRAMARLTGCTIAVVGIGAVAPHSLTNEPSHRRQVWRVTDAELGEFRVAGAVGEICTRFFDAAGEPCTTSLDRRMLAIDLREFRKVALVVGVASGPYKARAILGAVRGGYIKSLVTDDATAREMLKLASARADDDAVERTGSVGVVAGR